MKEFRNPATVHTPIALYSHQVEVCEPAHWLILSGQLGTKPDGTTSDDPLEQLDEAFKNVERNLEAAQMTMRDVVKLTIYLVGEFDVQKRRAIIRSHLQEYSPCVTMLIIAGLADPAYKVEIEAIAASAL